MAIKSKNAKLVERQGNHESGFHPKNDGFVQSAPCAVSVPDQALASAHQDLLTHPPQVPECDLDSIVIGTKLDPEMRWYVHIRPPRIELFDPAGVHCVDFSAALASLFDLLTSQGARKYANALRRFLDAADARSCDLDALLTSQAAARHAIARLLVAAGCRLRYRLLGGSAIGVTAPRELVNCVDLALTALSHAYDWFDRHDRFGFANPVAGEAAALPPRHDGRYRSSARHFILVNRRRSLPRHDDPDCIAAILCAARGWPPGFDMATRICAGAGCRISEVLALTVANWASEGFGETIAATNKGSGGEPVKLLWPDLELQSALAAYVDGPRRQQTGFGLADLRHLARVAPDHPALQAPLVLNSRGNAITYSAYNDHWFRPAMRRLGLERTPHWMRHERTLTCMRAIRQIAHDPVEREDLTRRYADMQGWRSGPEMAHYYAPQIRDDEQRDLAKLLAAQIDASGPAAPPRDRADAPVAQPLPPVLAAIVAGGSS